MRPTNAALLAIYARSLAKYEAAGDDERARVQRLMIRWVKTTRKN
jgi:hypothetical protein